MHKLNKTAICVEIGEGKRIDSFYLNKGAEIIQKFIQYAIDPSIAQSKAKHIDEETIKKIHSSKSGIFIPNEGALGKKTKIIGIFLNISDFSEKKITLKKSCKVLSLCVGGVISEGDLIAQVVE